MFVAGSQQVSTKGCKKPREQELIHQEGLSQKLMVIFLAASEASWMMAVEMKECGNLSRSTAHVVYKSGELGMYLLNLRQRSYCPLWHAMSVV